METTVPPTHTKQHDIPSATWCRCTVGSSASMITRRQNATAAPVNCTAAIAVAAPTPHRPPAIPQTASAVRTRTTRRRQAASCALEGMSTLEVHVAPSTTPTRADILGAGLSGCRVAGPRNGSPGDQLLKPLKPLEFYRKGNPNGVVGRQAVFGRQRTRRRREWQCATREATDGCAAHGAAGWCRAEHPPSLPWHPPAYRLPDLVGCHVAARVENYRQLPPETLA